MMRFWCAVVLFRVSVYRLNRINSALHIWPNPVFLDLFICFGESNLGSFVGYHFEYEFDVLPLEAAYFTENSSMAGSEVLAVAKADLPSLCHIKLVSNDVEELTGFRGVMFDPFE
jgi:hypothetical protein